MMRAICALPSRRIAQATGGEADMELTVVCSESSTTRSSSIGTPSPRQGNNDDDTEGFDCAICLDAFNPGDTVRLLPCGHDFHRECIDGWLTRPGVVPRCPLCKGAPIGNCVMPAAADAAATVTAPAAPAPAATAVATSTAAVPAVIAPLPGTDQHGMTEDQVSVSVADQQTEQTADMVNIAPVDIMEEDGENDHPARHGHTAAVSALERSTRQTRDAPFDSGRVISGWFSD